MIELQEIFEVKYGVNLELNKLTQSDDGVNFVSRTAKNNGVSAKVKPLDNVDPIPAGCISVAGGGSVLESFLQYEPFYSGRDMYYLSPKIELTDQQKLYYCACIKANKDKYSYGRQANRTLKYLKVPAVEDIPTWVNSTNISVFDGAQNSINKFSGDLQINPLKWKEFTYEELFEIKKGIRLTKSDMVLGETPFIGSTDSNNGLTALIGQNPIHKGNVLTLNYNGSVGECFYQPKDFWASDDVNVLYPKQSKFSRFNVYIALFFIPLIKVEQYRFNYGRKWHTERMKISKLVAPVKDDGLLDLDFMENYIKSLPFSSSV